MSYDILALHQREQVDERTLGDLFYNFGRPLPDIEIAVALAWLMRQLTGLGEKLGLTTTIIDELFDQFIRTLPNNLAQLLGNGV